MTDTFTAVPLVEPKGTVTLRQRKAQFGDGYQQRVQDGINAVVKTWPLTFIGSAAVITPLCTFFETHVGVSFYWTPPLGVQGYYQVAAYDLVPHGNDVYTLSATFEQVFKP